MPEIETLNLLEKELTEQIAGFDNSRQFYRHQQFTFTVATAALSASTTIFIGVGQILAQKWISILSLVCSAGITVLAAWDQFLRSRELWIQKTDTWMALQSLDADIKYTKAKLGDALSQDQIDEFYARFDQILTSEHESWKKVRGTQGGQSQTTKRGKRV